MQYPYLANVEFAIWQGFLTNAPLIVAIFADGGELGAARIDPHPAGEIEVK